MIPATVVVVGNVVQMVACPVYSGTSAYPNDHHICPLSWWIKAGVPVQTPMLLKCCPNDHYGIHVCIDGILKGQDLSLMRPRWLTYAKQAFTIAEQYGLTPALTL